MVEKERETALAANLELLRENYIANLATIQRLIEEQQFSRAGELLLSCPIDQRGWEWGRLMRQCSCDLLTIGNVELPDRPKGSMYYACFSPDERYILDDRPGYLTKSLIDLRTGKTVLLSKPYAGWRECTQFLPEDGLVSYSSSRHTVDIVNLWEDRILMQFDSGGGALRTFVQSPNGRLAAGYVLWEESGKREIILWDTSRGLELKRFRMEPFDHTRLPQIHPDSKWWEEKFWPPRGKVLGFLSDNRRLVFSDEMLGILDTNTGDRKLLAAVNHWQACFSGLSGVAAILNHSDFVEFWDIEEGCLLATTERPLIAGHLFQMAISEDGRWLATLHDTTWDLWRTDTGQHERNYRGHSTGILSVAFSPSGRCAVTVEQNEIKIWSVLMDRNMEIAGFQTADGHPSGLELYPQPPHAVHVFDNRLQNLITDNGYGVVSLWKAPFYRIGKRWQAHTDRITGAAFGPDGKLLATASLDGTAKIWDVLSGELLWKIDAESYRAFRGIAFSHDGKRLAVGTCTGRQDVEQNSEQAAGFEVRVYNTRSRQLLFALAQGELPICVLAYSPEGKWLSVGRGKDGGGPGMVELYDADTAEKSDGKPQDIGETISISFTTDSRYMLALGMTYQPVFWDIGRQQELWRLRAPETLGAAIHPDGDRVVLFSRQDKVTVHAALDGRELITLGIGCSPAAFSLNGRTLIHRKRNERQIVSLKTDDWKTISDRQQWFHASLQNFDETLATTF